MKVWDWLRWCFREKGGQEVVIVSRDGVTTARNMTWQEWRDHR